MRSVALVALYFVILYQGKKTHLNSKKVERISGQLTGPSCGGKIVCDVQYSLVAMGEVPSSCIYQRNDQPNSSFCFTKGLLPVTYIGKGKVKRKYLPLSHPHLQKNQFSSVSSFQNNPKKLLLMLLLWLLLFPMLVLLLLLL